MKEKGIKIQLEIKPAGDYRGTPTFDINPFLNNFYIMPKTKRKTIASKALYGEDDELITEGAVVIFEEVDNAEFIKLYAKNCKHFFDLTPAGVKILTLIFAIIQETAIGQDRIHFPYKIALKYAQKILGKKISSSLYSRGIKDLIQNRFIARSTDGESVFFINVNLLFNGDRYSFAKTYIKKGSKSATKVIKNIKEVIKEIPFMTEGNKNDQKGRDTKD